MKTRHCSAQFVDCSGTENGYEIDIGNDDSQQKTTTVLITYTVSQKVDHQLTVIAL